MFRKTLLAVGAVAALGACTNAAPAAERVVERTTRTTEPPETTEFELSEDSERIIMEVTFNDLDQEAKDGLCWGYETLTKAQFKAMAREHAPDTDPEVMYDVLAEKC